MKRDLKRLAAEPLDLLVIGGGISGAAIAWDAALRGLTVAVVDKRDFGGATSAATGKLIHGGLRYLKNGQIGIVRESLRERRIMESIAAHQVYPLPFVIPSYSLKDALMLKAGMLVYDALGFDKKRLAEPAKRIANHRRLNRAAVLELFAEIPTAGLRGGLLYYDCQMVCPERLTLEFVQSATNQGAVAANWLQVVGFDVAGGRIRAARVRDEVDGQQFEIQARQFVNASGCWADELLGLLSHGRQNDRLVRSKGIHILFDAIHPTHALAMITKTKRHVYLLPWRGLTLAGTTDTEYRGAPDDFVVTEQDVGQFIDELNGCYPALALSPDRVLAAYGGIRPLADTDAAQDSYQASRRHEIADHAADGLADNLISTLGGKYTTSRQLAEQTVDVVVQKLGTGKSSCLTATTRLIHAPQGTVGELEKRLRSDHEAASEDLIELLVTHYGSASDELLRLAEQEPPLGEPLWPRTPEIGAQIRYAVDHEMAMHLEDALYRRTGLCTLGRPPRQVLVDCGAIMGARLGWSEQQRNDEVARVESRLDALASAPPSRA